MSYIAEIPTIELKDANGSVVAELTNQEIEITNLDGPRTIKIDAYYDEGGNPVLKVRKHRIP